MPLPSRIDRRGFIFGAGRARRILELSCERLCMQFLDARAAGRVDQLVALLERDLAAADEVRLSHRDWLAREDFRAALGPLLLGRDAGRRRT